MKTASATLASNYSRFTDMNALYNTIRGAMIGMSFIVGTALTLGIYEVLTRRFSIPEPTMLLLVLVVILGSIALYLLSIPLSHVGKQKKKLELNAFTGNEKTSIASFLRVLGETGKTVSIKIPKSRTVILAEVVEGRPGEDKAQILLALYGANGRKWRGFVHYGGLKTLLTSQSAENKEYRGDAKEPWRRIAQIIKRLSEHLK